MKRLILALSLLVLLPSVARAQVTAGGKIGWDQIAPDLPTAQAYTYKYYPDNAATGSNLNTVTCVLTTGVIHCQAPFPAFTPGAHTIALTATNAAGESPKSGVFSFTFVVVPAAPGTPKNE
jgi:hypothetical protein